MRVVSNKILIRCDASPEIGFGHVVRCLALADQLRDCHDCEVEFAMLQGSQGIAKVQAQGYRVYHPEGGAELVDESNWLQSLIARLHHHVLILDVRTDLKTDAVQFIREAEVLIVTIDDPSDRRLYADLAFYPPVPQLNRISWNGFTGKLFVGWDWVLLRPQFEESAKRFGSGSKEARSGPGNWVKKPTLVVTMGGSDPEGFTIMALEAIEQIDDDLSVVLVVGSGFIHEAELADRLASTKLNYELHRDVTDFASLVIQADLAVTSFGTTVYELASLGLPSICVCLTPDHAVSASALEALGYTISLGIHNSVTPQIMRERISSELQRAKGSKLVVLPMNGTKNVPIEIFKALENENY